MNSHFSDQTTDFLLDQYEFRIDALQDRIKFLEAQLNNLDLK
tara:strand:+ start:694 stop:819 length:126 start_codon:yes stop_codon:yes gene_type:complete